MHLRESRKIVYYGTAKYPPSELPKRLPIAIDDRIQVAVMIEECVHCIHRQYRVKKSNLMIGLPQWFLQTDILFLPCSVLI